jgi:hypothetical protein
MPDGRALVKPADAALREGGGGIMVRGRMMEKWRPGDDWETFLATDLRKWRAAMNDGTSRRMIVIAHPNGEADILALTKTTANTEKFWKAKDIGDQFNNIMAKQMNKWVEGGPTAAELRRLGVHDFAAKYDLDVETLVRWKAEAAPAVTSKLASLPISKWTDANYKEAFQARFGHELVQVADDPGWTLERARTVATTIDPMPRCPDIAGARATKPLKLRARTLQQIQEVNKDWGAYYEPIPHEIVLPTEHLGGGAKALNRATFREASEATSKYTWGQEAIAHEYGHGLTQAIYGGWRPQIGMYSKMERLASKYSLMKARMDAKGGFEAWRGIFPSHYATTDAGEMLAECFAMARIAPIKFAREFPELASELRHYFSWAG